MTVMSVLTSGAGLGAYMTSTLEHPPGSLVRSAASADSRRTESATPARSAIDEAPAVRRKPQASEFAGEIVAARHCHEAHEGPVGAAERRVVAHRPQVILGGDDRRCCDPLRVPRIGLHDADDLAPASALRQPTEADVSHGT